jgi:hypothetical protein
LSGIEIVPGLTTLTLAVVSVTNGRALARMVVAPRAAAVTGIEIFDAFPGKMTVAGTVATPELSELRLTVKPPTGAGADRFNARFCVVIPGIVRLTGKKIAVAVTCTFALPPA